MATEEQQLKHKAGPLKQQNKTHKHGRHRTKGQLEKNNKGKVDLKHSSKKNKELDRQQRRHQAKQVRKNKRETVLEKKRQLGTETSPPHVIAILSLSPLCNSSEAVEKFISSDDSIVTIPVEDNKTIIISTRHKQRYTIINLDNLNLLTVLDTAKVADSFVFVVSASGDLSEESKNCLACLVAQGLPASVQLVQGLKDLPVKKQSETKKKISKSLSTWFPVLKLHSIDTNQDGTVVLRLITTQKQKNIFYRQRRPYLIAEKLQFVDSDVDDGVAADDGMGKGTLKVSGYLRGTPLCVNKLVHLPNLGDFQLIKIEGPVDPYIVRKQRSNTMESSGDSEMEETTQVLATADPSKQTSLDMEAEVDPMEGEQTWPTEEEIKQAQEAQKLLEEESRTTKRVPRGTSEYQAAWIPDDEDEDYEYSGDEEMDDELKPTDEHDDEFEEGMDDEFETMSLAATTVANDKKYDEHYDIDEDRRELEKYRAEHENEMFPDEIDTPMDINARDRFQRFRGLKSFRTSPWDCKENLPLDYARIFQFQNFTRSKKKMLNEEHDEIALPNTYVKIYIKNVPKTYVESWDKKRPLIIFGLLSHEQKMTVMHYVIKRTSGFDAPVKSKDRLIFDVGYRRFSACPIFSQHTNGNKFKMERFLPHKGVVVATIYSPILYPPAPVLVFNEASSLVATGTVLGSNPDRVITKKIVLSGHPFKINKRSSVVRYMFFNREDILWFKPVELFTKYGRRGHIKEALGTHGHMKCVFDGQLKAQDTVCMNLYKRVFPNWTYANIEPSSSAKESTHQDVEQNDEAM